MLIVTVSGAWVSKFCVHGTIVHVVLTEPVSSSDSARPRRSGWRSRTAGRRRTRRRSGSPRRARRPGTGRCRRRCSRCRECRWRCTSPRRPQLSQSLSLVQGASIVCSTQRLSSGVSGLPGSQHVERRGRRLALQVVARQRSARGIDLDALQLTGEVLDHRRHATRIETRVVAAVVATAREEPAALPTC